MNKKIKTKHLEIILLSAFITLASGCSCPYDDFDVVYAFKIPQSQADCDSLNEPGLIFRDGATMPDGSLDSGSSIVDRDSGSSIVDRNDNDVLKHCYRPCTDPLTPIGTTAIEWHKTGGFIIARQICVGEGSEPECPEIPECPSAGDEGDLVDTDRQ